MFHRFSRGTSSTVLLTFICLDQRADGQIVFIIIPILLLITLKTLLCLVVALIALQVCVCVCVCVHACVSGRGCLCTLFLTGAQGPPIEGDLRLNTESSTRPYSGRLEIYYNGQWGTVCDDGFSNTEADVACKQLGFVEALYYGNDIG